jgi:hypothetical protein
MDFLTVLYCSSVSTSTSVSSRRGRCFQVDAGGIVDQKAAVTGLSTTVPLLSPVDDAAAAAAGQYA